MLHKRFLPNLKKVEIEIITKCNLHCFNCNRSCRQAPSNEIMTTSQVRKFIHESMNLRWYWQYIGLLGGEPTLHPNLEEIYSILLEYKEAYPCIVELVTNGFGDRTKNLIHSSPLWVQIRNSQKAGPKQLFSSYNIAPRDLSRYVGTDFSSGCSITEHYGLGLTRYGYYPCGPGASVDRVFGFDIGLKTLGEVNTNSLLEQLRILCGYCGHFKDCDASQEDMKKEWIHEERQSMSWQNAYHKYHEQKPDLLIY